MRASAVSAPIGTVAVGALRALVGVPGLGFLGAAKPASRFSHTGLLVVVAPAILTLRDSGFVRLSDDRAPCPEEGDPGWNSPCWVLLYGEYHRSCLCSDRRFGPVGFLHLEADLSDDFVFYLLV